jgi:hypothetical protein
MRVGQAAATLPAPALFSDWIGFVGFNAEGLELPDREEY